MSLAVEIIFRYMAIKPEVIWQRLMGSHSNIMSPDEKGTFYNREVTLLGVEKYMKKYGKPHFFIEFKNAVFRYGDVANSDHSFLIIEKCIKDIDNAHCWVNQFLDLDSFVQGRIYDKEYEYWQNASDPLQYKAKGKSYDHLVMKSNGLPPPLEQKIIDTYQNPGRRIIRDGYVEAIGAIMWLGNQFWQLTGTKKEIIIAASWLKCEQIKPDILLIQVKNSNFINSDDNELQDNLRSLLFPEK